MFCRLFTGCLLSANCRLLHHHVDATLYQTDEEKESGPAQVRADGPQQRLVKQVLLLWAASLCW